MFIICLGSTLIATATTYSFDFKKINYTKLASQPELQNIKMSEIKTIPKKKKAEF